MLIKYSLGLYTARNAVSDSRDLIFTGMAFKSLLEHSLNCPTSIFVSASMKMIYLFHVGKSLYGLVGPNRVHILSPMY